MNNLTNRMQSLKLNRANRSPQPYSQRSISPYVVRPNLRFSTLGYRSIPHVPSQSQHTVGHQSPHAQQRYARSIRLMQSRLRRAVENGRMSPSRRWLKRYKQGEPHDIHMSTHANNSNVKKLEHKLRAEIEREVREVDPAVSKLPIHVALLMQKGLPQNVARKIALPVMHNAVKKSHYMYNHKERVEQIKADRKAARQAEEQIKAERKAAKEQIKAEREAARQAEARIRAERKRKRTSDLRSRAQIRHRRFE